MYQSKHFALHEYVPPHIIELRGDKAWELLDSRLLISDDGLRTRYGSITINNWFWGGTRLWSGLRTPESPDYSLTSQHTYGRASDKLFNDVTVDEVRADILAHPEKYPLIMSLELDVNWLHTDTRNCKRIKTYKPY